MPLEGSLGTSRGLVAFGTTPLVVSFPFSGALACSASLGGLVEEGRTLARLSLSTFVSLGTMSDLGLEELGRPDACITKG